MWHQKSHKIGCYLSSPSKWRSTEMMKRRDPRCVSGVNVVTTEIRAPKGLRLEPGTGCLCSSPLPNCFSFSCSSVCPHQPPHLRGAFPLWAQRNPPFLYFYPLPPSNTPTLFSSPTTPVYLFFHQIELAESKGIPAIPSQSRVRERDMEDERK